MSEQQKPAGDEPKRKRKSRARANRQLTVRQTRLVEGMAEGKTIKQAALDAGYTTKTPADSGWKALRNIRQGFHEAADELGITPKEFIKNHIFPLLKAERVQRSFFMGSKQEEYRDVDYAERRQAGALFARLMGALREEKEAGGGDVNYNFTVVNLVQASDDDIASILHAGARASRTIDLGGAGGMV